MPAAAVATAPARAIDMAQFVFFEIAHQVHSLFQERRNAPFRLAIIAMIGMPQQKINHCPKLRICFRLKQNSLRFLNFDCTTPVASDPRAAADPN